MHHQHVLSQQAVVLKSFISLLEENHDQKSEHICVTLSGHIFKSLLISLEMT